MKHTQWLATMTRCAGMILGVAAFACSDPSAPHAPATPNTEISAAFSFGTPQSDERIRAFLTRYELRPNAYLMYAGGLFGSDEGIDPVGAYFTLAAVRSHARDAARHGTASIYLRRDSLRALSGVISDADMADAAAQLLDLLQAHDVLDQVATSSPLVWGVRATASPAQLTAAGTDSAVVAFAIQDTTVNGSSQASVSAPAGLLTLERINPRGPLRRNAGLQWVGVPSAARSSVGLRSTTLAAPATYYPTSGDLYYDGNGYFNTNLVWQNPGNWADVRDLTLEIDLNLNKAFFGLWRGFTCGTWTSLPESYDKCPFAGILEESDIWAHSFGTWTPRAILAGTTYFGAWEFGSVPVGSSTAIGLDAQENYNQRCPAFTSIIGIRATACLQSEDSKLLISSLTAVITRGVPFHRRFNTAVPSILSISPSSINTVPLRTRTR